MRRSFISLTLLTLGLTGCTSVQALAVTSPVWKGQSYTVTSVDLRRDTLRLYWQNPANDKPFLRFQTLRDALAKRGERVLFATNSGIYTPSYAPLGLHIENGKTLVRLNNAPSSVGRGGGNFALRPNGVFWIGGQTAGVLETDAYRQANLSPDYATQSGPLLVIDNQLHPEFNARSRSFKRRSGVGVCQNGAVKFAISDAPVNFYTFATFFRDALKCPNALYLDGSISAVYTPELGDGQFVNFSGIWAVTTGK